MRNFIQLSPIVFIAFILSNGYCQMQSPIVIKDSRHHYSLDKHIQYCVDPNNNLTIEDICSPQIQKTFRNLPNGSSNLGFLGGSCWVRFHLHCDAKTTRWLLETHFANTQYLELYLPKSTGNFTVKKAGVLEATKEISYHTSIFKFDLVQGDKKTFFIRLKSDATIVLSFSIWSLDAFIENSQHQRLILGIFYGALGIMALYSLFLLVLLQEKNYVYFLMFVFSFLMFLLSYDGIIAQYFVTTTWNYWSVPYFFAFFLIFIIQFSIRVLNTKQRHPKLYKIIYLCFATWVLWLFTFPALGYLIGIRIAIVIAIVTLFLVCAVAIIDTWQKYRPAYYFSLSWLFFLFATTAEILTHTGLIARNPVTIYGYRIGVIILVLFLSISLANYIYLLREEKETIVKEQNTLLEKKVKERSAALVKAKEDAEKANQVKGEFLSMMSHEIRTPLNGVVGAIELLEKTQVLPEQQPYLKILQESRNHLLDVVNNILDYSKLDNDKIRLVHSDFNIKKCATNIVEVFRYQAQQKNVFLKCTLSEKIPDFVIASEQHVKQVLYNLIANAVKFTNQGQIELRITVAKQNENQTTLLIEVEDSGIGIPPDKVHLLFNPFSQISPSTGERQQGSGLGLAISQKLVCLMGGKIHVESGVGKGSKFYFTLDCKISSTTISQEYQNYSHLQSFAKKWPLNILIAEDNQINQVLIVHMLKEFGYDAVIVNDGKEAIEHLQNCPCDLIFMDGQMPNMDGIETTKFIHENFPKEKHPVIIAVTGDALAVHKKKYLEAGMQGFISKPVYLDKIKKMLEKWAPIIHNNV